MRRLFLMAPLLVSACVSSAPQPVAPADPGRAPTTAPSPPFICRAFDRPSVHVSPNPIGEIRMSEPGDRSISSAIFRFRVLYNDDRYDSPALIIYVYSNSTGRMIEKSLFQFSRQKHPVNQFAGGHGFTGLHYVYAPDSAAELQYMCSRG